MPVGDVGGPVRGDGPRAVMVSTSGGRPARLYGEADDRRENDDGVVADNDLQQAERWDHQAGDAYLAFGAPAIGEDTWSVPFVAELRQLVLPASSGWSCAATHSV